MRVTGQRGGEHGSGTARSPRTFHETFFRLSRSIPYRISETRGGRSRANQRALDVCRYRNMIGPWPALPRRRTSSTPLPTGTVTCRAEGRRRLYRLEPARLRPLREWLAAYEQVWNARMDRVDDYLKELQQQGGVSDT
jgi:hypothetical protein